MSALTLSESHRQRLKLIYQAANLDDLGIAWSRDLQTGELVTLVLAREWLDDGSVRLVPLAAITDDNPYDRYAHPDLVED